jgi:hypothetical protein
MKLVSGVFVAFFVGMLWKRATAAGATLAIIIGVVFSYTAGPIYQSKVESQPASVGTGSEINAGSGNPFTFQSEQAVQFARTLPRTDANMAADQPLYVSFPEAEDRSRISLHMTEAEARFGRNPLRFMEPEPLAATLYDWRSHGVVNKFGPELNFFHATVISVFLSTLAMVLASLMTPANPEKAEFTWTGLGGYSPSQLQAAFGQVFVTIVIYILLALAMLNWGFPPAVSGGIALLWTWAMFVIQPILRFRPSDETPGLVIMLLREDRFYAGLLGGLAVFLMYYYV